MQNLIDQHATEDSDDDSSDDDEVDPAEFGYLLCSRRGFSPDQLASDNEAVRERITALLSQRQ